MILIPWSIPLVMLFYMWGGQTMKWIRPVGVALSISGIYFLGHLQDPHWWRGFIAWLYGLELAFGYGDDSWLHKITNGNDDLIRLLYSIWCCVPVLATVIIAKTWWPVFGMPLIGFAFLIHAGAAKFKVFGKDFLWEDFWRSLAIGFSMNWALGMLF